MRSWLRTLRIDKGLTMKEMGEKLGISESYYSMVEAGERQKKLDFTIASGIASVLEIPVAEVVELERTPTGE